MRISDWSSDVCSSDLVEHLVGLVEHRDAQRRQVERPAFEMVAQPARRADDDMHALIQRPAFLAGVHAADAGRDASTRFGIEPAEFARSEEHTSELQSLMRNSYAVFSLKKNTNTIYTKSSSQQP